MDQITARTLRNVEWEQVYNYEGTPGKGFRSYGFTVYASDALPGLTITKERRGMKRVKTTTIYKFDGRRTDSPTQVVKYYNEKARGHKQASSVSGPGRSERQKLGDIIWRIGCDNSGLAKRNIKRW